MITLALAFVAGLLTILSPCVLPLAPIVIAGARASDARGPLALAMGLALTFGLVGGSLASVGVELGDNGLIRIVAAAAMVLVGIIMLVPMFGDGASRLLGPIAAVGERLSGWLPQAGLVGQFCAGIVLAFAWAPCVGPTLGAAFALAASGGSLPAAMITMGVFALGAATSLLGAGYGLSRLAASGRTVAARTARVGKSVLASVLLLTGGAILSGMDKVVEARLVEMMPDWLAIAATRI